MKKRHSQPDKTPEQNHPTLVSDEDNTVIPTLETAAEDDASEDALENLGGAEYELQGKAWKGWVFALVPIAVIFLGAGREAWSKGLAAVLMALLLLVFPIRRRLPPFAAICLLGAFLAPLLAFLPSSWQMQQPAWLPSLVNDWGIQLSPMLTPQAWITFESWLFFAACVVWLGWCLGRGFSNEQRLSMLRALAIGGIVICLLAVVERMRWVDIPWWPRSQAWGIGFGPFANRNHTSSLAAIICLLVAAAAYDAHRRRSRTLLIFVLGMGSPLTCIFMNTSRAGVLLLFIGLTTWFGTVAMRKSFFQKMAMSATLICVIGSLILMAEGGVSTRLKAGESASSTSLTRSNILIETLGMATHSPWLGVGLGNFDPVFPLVSNMDSPRYRFIHPESDFLWLLVEGGLLTLVPSCLLVVWIFNSTGPWFGKKKKGTSNRLDRRLRNAAAIAFGIGALHGLADVPNHSLGYALAMALLAGIAIRPRRLRYSSTWAGRLAFRTAGLALLVVGIGWINVSLGHPSLPGRSAAESLRARANQLTDNGSIGDALPLMNEAIRLSPMSYNFYYERARMRLYNGQKEEALLDFSRSRALDPHYSPLCYLEGLAWLDIDPQYAIIGWREFLRRDPIAAPGIWGHFRQMVNYSQRHPELREPLWSLAESAELKLDFLTTVSTREEFDRCLRSLLAMRPNLEGLDPSQRETLFDLWSRLGDEKALIAALETNKKWREDGWRILAAYYARNSDFRTACQTASAYLPSLNRGSPGGSGDIASLERALLYNPEDVRIGIDLFQAQKNQGEIDLALHTLEKIVAHPHAPAYVRQEIAALYMAKEDYRRAWEVYQAAMQKR